MNWLIFSRKRTKIKYVRCTFPYVSLVPHFKFLIDYEPARISQFMATSKSFGTMARRDCHSHSGTFFQRISPKKPTSNFSSFFIGPRSVNLFEKVAEVAFEIPLDRTGPADFLARHSQSRVKRADSFHSIQCVDANLFPVFAATFSVHLSRRLTRRLP